MSISSKLRGFKVADSKRSRICGVACATLSDLRLKGCRKLNISNSEASKVAILLQDGTFVEDDDYFQTLPAQTLFIFQKKGETALTGYQILYNALQAVHSDYLHCGEEAMKFFDRTTKDKLLKLLKNSSQNEEKKSLCHLSHRNEHPEWFEPLDTRLQTKEDYMSSRARDRVRGYLYKTQDELRKRTDCRKQQKIIENVLAKLKAQLTKDGHFGSYFDRKTKVISNRFCNPSGYFQCEGRWDVGKCLYHENLHGINPYESHEMMVIFSTWNLDHGIERSRTIIPSLLEATKIALDCDKEDKLNWEYFYSLLFTRSNLRLVHIVCHDKGSHTSRTCDPGEYFMECKNR
ncbi:DNA fragmentation factor subunit beta isoform X1 [Ischnura elegans]|uniref:DNA fragmentation factor subunit beta isoform X1 n=1 Tax=Ischnura elegans TaxID=197161 RepID=UPI001ED8AC79|nr:DNA fragmentation factor subunit beta isoform X1 [Ischnura elegans]